MCPRSRRFRSIFWAIAIGAASNSTSVPSSCIAVSWIRSYGKGRIFYTSLGHTPALFESPEMSKFLLAAIQFVLGDLDADTTPSAKATTAR